MLKRTINYEDFNGEKVSEVFYFNLSQSELIELEVGYEGGLEKSINKIIATQDHKSLIAEFKKLILLSYGVKSEDGKRFIKNDELRENFAQTAAYDALFMQLATDANAAATFVNGIIPKAVHDMKPQDKPIGPPRPPSI